MVGSGGAVTPDTAVTLSISKLAALLGVKPTLLRNILGTNKVELRDQPKIVAGGIDTELDMGFWTFFNKIGSIHTLNAPREPFFHNLHRKCTNGAVNAGNHTWKLEPAPNSLIFIFMLSQVNRDIVNRINYAQLYTSGGVDFARLYYIDLAAASIQSYPNKVSSAPYLNWSPIVLSDMMEVLMGSNAVDVGQDTDFHLVFSYIGDAPTLTEDGPIGCTWSEIA